MADLIAGSVAFERRLMSGEAGKRESMKGVVGRLKSAFGVADLSDCRTERVNIYTWDSTPRLQVVEGGKAAG